MGDDSIRVFISYSHDSPEHEERVRALADRLNREGIECVIDQYEPHPREPWRRWMERQLEDADFVLVVCTEPYFLRSQGREEAGRGLGATFEADLILADLYQDGMWNDRYVSVFFDLGDAKFIPRPLGGFTHYLLMRDYEDLYRHLTTQPKVVRPPLGSLRSLPPEKAPLLPWATATPLPSPKLPPHYRERLVPFAEIKRDLLAPVATKLGITGAGSVGVQGMGGIGKSVLAAAVARDPEIRESFADGVFWLLVGQQPDLIGLLGDLARALGDLPPAFSASERERAKHHVAGLLAARAVLLVLDDVWSLDSALALDVVGPRGRLLLTTRNREVLVGLGATEHRLPLLTPDQARELLADWSGVPVSELPEIANAIIRECGYLPLAVAMTGAMIRLRPTAWDDTLARLQKAELAKIRATFPDYPYPDLLRALEVSVESLEPAERERYLELAVFPKDAAIPEAVLDVLWGAAGMSPDGARDLAAALAARSLALQEMAGHLRLHDLQGDYLRKRVGDLKLLHRRLVEAYRARCSGNFAKGPDDGYFFQHLPFHLAAGEEAELKDLLLDFAWLQAKLEAAGIDPLLRDYAFLAQEGAPRKVEAALRLSAHVLARDPHQLAGHLLGRLAAPESEDLGGLLAGAQAWRGARWLRPRFPSLIAPDTGLLRTLEGHSREINAVAQLDQRRVVSASSDHTLRVWEVDSGRALRVLEGHSREVNAVARLDQRRVVSASSDHTLRVWDVDSGQTLGTLEGHSGGVLAVAWLDERRVISASDDSTLRVWDVDSGQTLRTLKGHSRCVNAVARLDDRRAVSASDDGTLRLWDVDSGKSLRRLRGHSFGVLAVARLDDRRIVSASSDGTLRLWDIDSGKTFRRLEGHSRWVNAVAPLDDRRVVSASSDGAVRVWDVDSGQTLRCLEGHTLGVLAVAPLDGRRVVSASSDGTLRVWDVDSGPLPLSLEKHSRGVTAIVGLDGRRVVSASYDSTLRVWDVDSGLTLRTLEGHSGGILAVARLDKQRVVSASSDGTLRVWDVGSGRTLRSLDSHSRAIRAVASLGKRRVVSASNDGTLRVWDIDSGQILLTLEGPFEVINAVAPLDERRVVSASDDGTLQVWDVDSGRTLFSLAGHSDAVRAVARLDKRRIVSASDDGTLRVWDVQSSQAVRSLKTQHSGGILAVACLDERRVVSSASDGTLCVWDVDFCSILATFCLDRPCLAVESLPDRRTLVAGDQFGTLHFLVLEEP